MTFQTECGGGDYHDVSIEEKLEPPGKRRSCALSCHIGLLEFRNAQCADKGLPGALQRLVLQPASRHEWR
eukprot:7931607-Alexandrium_andersonii.AAC.1